MSALLRPRYSPVLSASTAARAVSSFNHVCLSDHTCNVMCHRLPDGVISTLCELQGMYALFVSSEEMYLCIDSYSSWITRSCFPA